RVQIVDADDGVPTSRGECLAVRPEGEHADGREAGRGAFLDVENLEHHVGVRVPHVNLRTSRGGEFLAVGRPGDRVQRAGILEITYDLFLLDVPQVDLVAVHPERKRFAVGGER